MGCLTGCCIWESQSDVMHTGDGWIWLIVLAFNRIIVMLVLLIRAPTWMKLMPIPTLLCIAWFLDVHWFWKGLHKNFFAFLVADCSLSFPTLTMCWFRFFQRFSLHERRVLGSDFFFLTATNSLTEGKLISCLSYVAYLGCSGSFVWLCWMWRRTGQKGKKNNYAAGEKPPKTAILVWSFVFCTTLCLNMMKYTYMHACTVATVLRRLHRSIFFFF